MPALQQAQLQPWLDALSAGRPLADASYPFCFVYGEEASSSLLPNWALSVSTSPASAGLSVLRYTWTEQPVPSSGAKLVVRVNVTIYKNVTSGLPASDFVLGLSNEGTGATLPVRTPNTVNAGWFTDPSEPVRLYTRVGGDGGPVDYHPGSDKQAHPPRMLLNSSDETVLQNQCGTVSYGTLPFFQMEWPRSLQGILFSLGWGGQWLARIARSNNATTVSAGLGGRYCADAGILRQGDDAMYPAISLIPGERLRLMRALVVPYMVHHTASGAIGGGGKASGAAVMEESGAAASVSSMLHQIGLNAHRRLILDYIAPRATDTPGSWPWSSTNSTDTEVPKTAATTTTPRPTAHTTQAPNSAVDAVGGPEGSNGSNGSNRSNGSNVSNAGSRQRLHSLVLADPNGFYPGAFNHEALTVTTEAQCKISCLDTPTCVGLTWVDRSGEPCVHYQKMNFSAEPRVLEVMPTQ
jgi:hypothetical protein